METYRGSTLLKKTNVSVAYTQEQVEEYIKCSNDVEYFISKYIRIVNVDKGLIPFEMYPFQKKMVNTFAKERFVITKMPRQSGKCFSINTLIRLKNKHTGVEFETTIESFIKGRTKSQILPTQHYEIQTMYKMQDREKPHSFQQFKHRLLGGMSDLYFASQGYIQPLVSYSQYDKYSVSRTISNKSNEIENISRETIKTNSRKEQSSVWSWRKVFSIFKEICKGKYLQTNNTKSASIKNSIKYIHNNNRVLVEKNQWKSSRSSKITERTPDNLFSRKMYRKTWIGKRYENLVKTSTKMVQFLQKTKLFQNISKIIFGNNEPLQINFSIFCDIQQNRNERLSKQGIQINSFKWKNNSSRFHRYIDEKNNRIRWNILAQPKTSKHESGRNKRSNDNTFWLSNIACERTRLQTKSPTSYSGVHKLSDTIERKFIESYDVSEYEIWTDSGWQPLSYLNKTIPYEKWVLKTENHSIECADTHILFDENMNEIFTKDLKIGDKIQTEKGLETVICVENTHILENMYDFSVNSDNHRYYTNGILSHNSTTVVSYVLWRILFYDNMSIAILANKGRLAMELLDKIKMAYEYLPKWLQQGIITWNKGSIELENGSKVLAAATSSSAVRGGSYNILFLDEFAFVQKNLAEQFFASVYPTISSGNTTQIIIVSTPNGMNHYYKMWMDATTKKNAYIPIDVHWREVPGRDDKFRERSEEHTSELQSQR